MAEIETYRKKPVEVEMMLWDGSQLCADQIGIWVGLVEPFQPGFVVDPEDGGLLWVAHNNSWCTLPVGYRVAKELDGSGFYPLSPEGFIAGYVVPAGETTPEEPRHCGATSVWWPDDEACDAECMLPAGHEPATRHEDRILGSWDEDELPTSPGVSE